MKKMKLILLLTMLALVSTNTFASTISIARVLVESARLNLLSHGLVETQQVFFRTTVNNAIESLLGAAASDLAPAVRAQRLVEAIERFTPITEEQTRLKSELLAFLNTRSGSRSFTTRELVAATRALAEIAAQAGTHTATLACSACLRGADDVIGEALIIPTNPRLIAARNSVVNNWAELNRTLANAASMIGPMTGRTFNAEEKVNMAIFIHMSRNGNALEKEYAQEVIKLSTHGNQVHLAHPDLDQTFWAVFATDPSPQELRTMLASLRQLNEQLSSVPLNQRKNRLRNLLDDMINNPNLDEETRQAAREFKQKRCYFASGL